MGRRAVLAEVSPAKPGMGPADAAPPQALPARMAAVAKLISWRLMRSSVRFRCVRSDCQPMGRPLGSPRRRQPETLNHEPAEGRRVVEHVSGERCEDDPLITDTTAGSRCRSFCGWTE